jgi:hypothetical protein
MRKNSRIKLVISSSWRKTDNFTSVLHHSRMRKYFPIDLRMRVVGCTPALRGILCDEPDYLRQREICAWLQSKKSSHVPYAILDDAYDMFEPDLSTLVLCDPKIGFDDAIEAKLQAIVDRVLSN